MAFRASFLDAALHLRRMACQAEEGNLPLYRPKYASSSIWIVSRNPA
jgi:hypothetical protein